MLVPEHLRLGTWDLISSWTTAPTPQVQSRLALQLVHEAALCITGIRKARGLSQRGFELANGLPFVATDTSIHGLLDKHTMDEARRLQMALGLIRRCRGHFVGRRLAIDPHRLRSWTKRQMRQRRPNHQDQTAYKMAQTFFALDVDTAQPVCLTTATASRTVSQATPDLLDLVRDILQPQATAKPLVLADCEHFSAELFDEVRQRRNFDLLVPMPNRASFKQELAAWPQERFVRRWAGFATAKAPLERRPEFGPLFQLIQRCGEIPKQYIYKAFQSTTDADEVAALTRDFPSRWHVEQFFDAEQALGWQRAGTLNLHVRYGQMSLALLAQAALYQWRQRVGEPFCRWEADHIAKNMFAGLDGDIRVRDNTILVTYYNALQAAKLHAHYQDLPAKLRAEGVDPRIPWLYNFQLDFRFK